MTKIVSEVELYEPMRLWLQEYITHKYPSYKVETLDSHNIRLDRALQKINIQCDIAVGIDIQIDVLGVAKNRKGTKLFFIEAKKNKLSLRDLGQLWAYCKLINPEEAFLLTCDDLGSLNKLLNVFNREDLLDFGDGKQIKKMKVAVWNLNSNSPDMASLIPKL